MAVTPEVDGARFRTQLVAALARRGVAAELADHTLEAAEAHQASPAAALVELGVEDEVVLEALAEASGLPLAPLGRLIAPPPELAQAVNLQACEALGAAPWVDAAGALHLAYADPRSVASEAARALPPHRPSLALEAQVRSALALLAGADKHRAPTARPEPDTNPLSRPVGAHGPKQLGGFQLERPLGQGGMAAVYLAREPGTGRATALKVMLAHLAGEEDFAQRFLQEARATRTLRHPNVVEMLAVGEDPACPFIAYEFVDGGTVDDLLERHRKVPPPLAAELLAQTLAGVGAAHAAGIIHRDLKPANLLLSTSGLLKVGDFGIAKVANSAKLTQTGLLVGTPSYMSPEQAAGTPLGPGSDLYTAGVILFELLTGVNPNHHENPATAITRILQGAPLAILEAEPTCPPELEAVLDRLTARDPAVRYASADEALADLQPYLAQVRARGNVLAEVLAQPEPALAAWRTWEAERALAAAQPLLQAGGPTELRQAVLHLYRAVLLDPGHAQARPLFDELVAREKISFAPSQNPKVRELEFALEQNPAAHGVALQLGHLYKLEGNVHQASLYLRRYLRLRPADGYAAGQLQQLTGQRPPMPMRAGPSTSALVEGIATGGFRAAPPASPPPASAPAPEPQPASEPGFVEYAPGQETPSVARQVWRAYGAQALGALAVVGLLGWGLHRVGRAIDTAAADSDRLAQDVARQHAQAEQDRLDKGSRDELARLSAESREAAAKLLNDGVAAYHAADYARAATVLAQLGERYPKRPEAQAGLLWLAKAQLAQSQFGEALTGFTSYLQRYPASPEAAEAQLRSGQAQAGLGLQAAAVESYGAFMERYPTSPLLAEGLLLRAESRAALGKAEEAAQDYEAALSRLGPSDPWRARAEKGLAGVKAK